MMASTHVKCQQPHTYKLVIADDAGLALIRWCEVCDCALTDADVDPPQGINIADIPPERIAELIEASSDDGGTTH